MTFRRARRGDASGAIVIGAEYRGLGVVQSLGRRGVPVWVCSQGDDVLARLSRYCRRGVALPSTDQSAQVDFILDLARRNDLVGWVLFPSGDETAAMISKHHDVLARHYRLTTPPWEVFRWAYDKRLTYQLATSVGVPVPRTHYPTSAEALIELDVTFPAVVKPACKPELNRFTVAKAWAANDMPTLVARYAEAATLLRPELLFVQEVVPGGSNEQLSFAAVCRDGEALVCVVARRTRQFPMDFGRASTFVETVDAPDVESAARSILSHLRYTGLVEVEFKRDPRDRTLRLLDVNPRVWGWHTLGRRTGLDVAFGAWSVARGEPVNPRHSEPGWRWVRMATDGPTAVREIARGRLGTASYLRSIAPPHDSGTFALDDPLPGLMELPLLAFAMLRRRRRAGFV